MLPEPHRLVSSSTALAPDRSVVSPASDVVTTAAPRILIVDDEQYMCDLCSRALTRAAYDVTATTDSLRALELLKASSFDILITDIQMPSISGLDLAQQARTVDPAIVIIVMTGHGSMENLQQAVQRGIADFLNKPFEIEQLRLAVDQALHKRRLLQDNLRLQALVGLLSSSNTINTSLDLLELSRSIIRVVLHETAYAAGALLLSDGSNGLDVVTCSDDQFEVQESGLALAYRALAGDVLQEADGDAALLRAEAVTYANGLALPLKAQGQFVGVLLLCSEGSERRPLSIEAIRILLNQAGSAIRNAQQHRELRETYQRLQEFDHMKSEFIAVASHELRTPLSIVLGYTMMVRDQLDGEQRVYLQRVLENAHRIKGIVDDMINLRYLESGQATLDLTRNDLNALINEVYAQMRPVAEEKSQELRLLVASVPVMCMLDREKFQLVLSHLLSNAIKFTGCAGWVELRAAVQQGTPLHAQQLGTVAVAMHQQPQSDAWIVIEVQDNGVGIPLKDQGRIFDRFYQVADSLTRDHGGTGLGLAIVKELVSVMGGYLSVTSEVGHGSTFSLTLPLTLS